MTCRLRYSCSHLPFMFIYRCSLLFPTYYPITNGYNRRVLSLTEGLTKIMCTSARPHFILCFMVNSSLDSGYYLALVSLPPLYTLLFQEQTVVHASINFINFSIGMALILTLCRYICLSRFSNCIHCWHTRQPD